jgi:K+-transporting ATPase ATPase A chain
MWLIPTLVLAISALLAIPLGLWLACALDRPNPGNRVERWLDTGLQTWRQYCFSLLIFNAMVFAAGFVILALQEYLPLNPDHRKTLAPSTVFNTACSFITNTNLQHYSGEVHLSYHSQLFVILWKQFITPAIGMAALLAVIRGLRGDSHVGNFYLDAWRTVFYVLLPLGLVISILLLWSGVPMTLEGVASVTTLEGATQQISRGPVAAFIPMKQLGTNGGGFFGANSTHPFENPNAWTNLIECVCILIIPMACVVMFGKMLRAMRQAAVIGGVLFLFLIGMTVWTVSTDALQPNPGLAGLAVNQDGVGNLEGKELRFGPGAAAVWAASTTATSNGSVNAMHDSLNPLAGLAPLTGMWLNCIFGGVGVGLINLLVYLIIAVFLSGLMVGRTPEYLGKKVEAREMKLAMLSLLIHPILILAPTGLFAIKEWGTESISNPGSHGLSQILYEFSSASANNGSGFEGLGDTYGFAEDKPSAKFAFQWDIATGLVMILGRFIPIIAPIALAACLARKKPTPFTAGTLRTDTFTFAIVLLGIILLVGALLFLPVAALGPVAEHLGPMPFGK